MPNWREVIRRGGNATTNFSVNVYKPFPIRIFAGCTVNKYPPHPWQNKITTYYWGTPNSGISCPTFGVFPAGTISRMDLLAREQFLKKYREARTAFQSGVFFGELAQTVRMIKSPAKALREGLNRYYRDVKKRSRGRRNARSANKIVGETWLEYSFGWRPLIRDVESAVRLACALPDRYRQTIKAVGAENFKSTQRTENGAPFVSYPYWEEILQSDCLSMVIYRGAVDASISPPSFPEQLGLSWSNLLPTIWELIPYSFLVDYFSNVGTVIEGISTGNIGLSWGARTTRRVIETTLATKIMHRNLVLAVGHPNCSSFVDGAGLVGRRVEIARNPISQVSVGISDLRLRVPGATSVKWLNIAALATLRK
jgi:hypothetical protein